MVDVAPAAVHMNGTAANGTMVAVGAAQTPLPTPDLKNLRLVDTQTRAIGVIVPPPDIRAIVDKTAAFVGKNGVEFERRILANEANNVKFNFLKSGDPYHAYYQQKVAEAKGEVEKPRDASGTAAAATPGQPAAPLAPAAAAAAATTAVVQATPTAPPKVLVKPDDPQYMATIPNGISSLDLDVIRLTAQCVARNGKTFLTGLAQRENNNLQFNFLKPTHSLFSFFTNLCDIYSRVLMPPKDLASKLQKIAEDRQFVLERCLKRLEWEQLKEKEAAEAADEAEKERTAMQQIDWHDFVVVETIEFFDDEDDELPTPLTLREVVQLSRNPQAAAAAAAEEEEAAAADQAQDMEMDDEERAMVAEAAASALPPPTEPPLAPPAAPPAPPSATVIAEDDNEPIKIVKNYQRPDVRSSNTGHDPTKFVVSPITGELVPLADMAEHMRISLLDPRWKEQRDAMMAKIRDTTQADNDEIGRNLIGLAKTRPDIFGSTKEEVQSVVQQSIQAAKTTDRPVVWDGTKGPELTSQIKNLQQGKGSAQAAPVDAGPPKPVAGPTAPPVARPPVQLPPAPGAPPAPFAPPMAPPPGPPQSPSKEEHQAKRQRTDAQ